MRIIKTDTRARIVVDLQPARKIKFIVPQLFNGSRDKINNNFGISNCARFNPPLSRISPFINKGRNDRINLRDKILMKLPQKLGQQINLQINSQITRNKTIVILFSIFSQAVSLP